MSKLDMAQHFSWPGLLKYVAPSIAMMLFTSAYYLVDGLFVSNFAGKDALAGVNFVMPLIMILGTVGFMTGSGGTALVSKVRGEGDEVRANRYFSLITYATIVAGAALSVLGFFLAEPLSQAMGATEGMLAQCVAYMQISMVSLTFFMLQYMFQSFFAAAGKPKLGFYIVVAAGVTNMVLDALLVGLLGFGAAGAAWATVASEIVGGGIPLLYFARKNASFLRLGATNFDGRALLQTCSNGLSELMSNISMSVVGALYNLQLMAYLGADGVAAYGVIMYVEILFVSIFEGYNIGASPLMSFQYGAQNHREMNNLLRKGLLFALVGGICMFIVSQATAHTISCLYVGYDEELLQLTESGFRIFSLAFLLVGFSIFGSALFTALNNGVVSAIISFLRTLVFEAGAILLLPLIWGAQGIWFSVVVAESISLVLTLAFVFGLRKRYHYLRR